MPLTSESPASPAEVLRLVALTGMNFAYAVELFRPHHRGRRAGVTGLTAGGGSRVSPASCPNDSSSP